MKAYIIRPKMDIFDGNALLATEVARTLRLIAEMVADSLQEGGDKSHQAAVWGGPTEVGTRPTVVRVADRQTLVSLAFRLLDPNDPLGGDIRSAVNCRTVTFGQDGQAVLCLRHDDAAPMTAESALLNVAECSGWLAETDLFDGGWPSA